MMLIKQFENDHISQAKLLADQNRFSLGFIPKKKLEEIIEQRRGMVAIEENRVIGFVIYRHRKTDLQTTLSEICVQGNYRNQSIGKQLIDSLIQDCIDRSREYIQLKCPIDLPANDFYKELGFKLFATEVGKRRKINVWRFDIMKNQK